MSLPCRHIMPVGMDHRGHCCRGDYPARARPCGCAEDATRQSPREVSRWYRLAGTPHGLTELQRLGHERLKASRAGEPPRKITTPRWPELASRFSDENLLDCIRRLHTQHGF